MRVKTYAGQLLTLADAPFNEGGEGKLYDIKGKRGYVAKVYTDRRLLATREEKIRVMAALPAQRELPANLAWPVNVLYDEDDAFKGFVMKRVKSSCTIGEMYAFPTSKVPVEHRLKVLISLCKTYGYLHAAGQAVGDGNPDNVLVLKDCTVELIDTDSFAIRDPASGTLHRCDGCAFGFAAPEMIKAGRGIGYRNAARAFDEGTDRFVLAIHIAKALMNGANPYLYVPDARSPEGLRAPSIERCIEEGWAAPFVSRPGLGPAPYAPAIASFPPYLRDALYQALVAGATDPSSRPSAFAWCDILERYANELERCPHDASHSHWRGASVCPYCEAEQRFGRLQAKLCGDSKGSAGSTSAAEPRSKARAAGAWGKATGGAASGSSRKSGNGNKTKVAVAPSVNVTVTATKAASVPKAVTGTASAARARSAAKRVWKGLSDMLVTSGCALLTLASVLALGSLEALHLLLHTVMGSVTDMDLLLIAVAGLVAGVAGARKRPGRTVAARAARAALMPPVGMVLGVALLMAPRAVLQLAGFAGGVAPSLLEGALSLVSGLIEGASSLFALIAGELGM